jgi:hypothetical protein
MTVRSLVLVALGAFGAALVAGCPKKEAPVVQEAGPPPAPEPTAPQITELAPLEDDSGPPADAASEAGKKWRAGGGSSANQLKIKECCNAIRTQAKTIGASPEAFQLNALAVQCDAFAAQMGAQGNAPELNQLRQILKTAKVPLACQM